MKKLLLILAVTIMAILLTACVDKSTNSAPTEQQSPTDEELSVSKKNCIKRVGQYMNQGYTHTVILLENGQSLKWADFKYPQFTILKAGDTISYIGEEPLKLYPK